ncbi:MAG: flagellar hook capping FlgD N-terminal domain-containing protein [Verrucomicrobiota bacterium]
MQILSSTASNIGGIAGALDGSTVPTAASQSLSQADFLKLLVAQMTAQDPLNPSSNQDLLTQTAQLSSLQSNTSLQSTLAEMQATSMVGKQVTLKLQTDQGVSTTQGVVSGITFTSGKPQIVVGGLAYDANQVIAITNPTTTSSNP